MHKFAVQATRIVVALFIATSAAAAPVSATAEALLGTNGHAAGLTSITPLATTTGELRSGFVRTTTSRDDSAVAVATSSPSAADTVAMLVAAMAIMAVVVRRRWDTR